MKNNSTPLFVGDPIETRSERLLIARLRRDLARRAVSACLYANFYPIGGNQRQIDLLVRTPHRTAHVEIKGLDPRLPVEARPNGHWVRVGDDGTRHALGGNFGRQALSGTYSISDAMRGLARSGVVPSAAKTHARDIDTLVCVWERVPSGSVIDPPPHVAVVSYAELVERLATPGPVLAWDAEDWEAFARHLGLFQPEPESQVERGRRVGAEAVADYRSRARATFAAGLANLVDTGTEDSDGRDGSFDDVERLVASGASVMLVGRSGAGKTFYAQHVALRHCDLGRLVIWARCGEYQRGRLSVLLAKAAAPFSAQSYRELADRAQEAGVGVTVIFDGLDECPGPLRAELLQQVSAFQLRVPSSVVITSTIAGPSGGSLSLHTLRLRDPDGDARLRILAIHGASNPERVSAAFRTPYELSVAAACEGELSSEDGTYELHDAYVRRFTPSEQLRSGLRAVATLLHEQFRSTAPVRDVIALLGSAGGLGWTPAQIDELLGCHLLVVERNRVRFRHELIARYLAGEDIVRRSPNGKQLGVVLSAPANEILRQAALAVETDIRRRWEAFEELAEVDLFTAALAGDFGSAAKDHATSEIRCLINEAVAATDLSSVEFEFAAGDMYSARWKSSRRWSPAERAMLAAAGVALPTGCFVDEIARLADRTDELCLHYAVDLRDAGAPAPVSTVVAATYTQLTTRDDECLPISIVATACELGWMGRHENRAGGVAGRLADSDRQRPWGRLYLSALTINTDSSEDQDAFPQLLRRAWDAGGYHLRLQVLQVAQFFGRTANGPRDAILSVLRTLEPDNWAHSTTLVEALAAFGDIKSGVTPEELRANIREVLADSRAPAHWKLASGIISNQFEDQDIVGPYCEAIQDLKPFERVQLLCMAARGAEHSLHLSWTLSELARLAPTGHAIDVEAQDVFRRFLAPPVLSSVLPSENVEAWVAAIYGWSKFANTLPPPDAEPTDDGLAWRLLGRLIFYLANPAAIDEPESIWSLVCSRCADEAVDVVFWLRTIADPWEDRQDILPALASRFPDQLCALLEGSLHSRSKTSARGNHALSRHRFVIDLLGEVGTRATVELLRLHTLDPDTAGDAVAAIRRIHERAR